MSQRPIHCRHPNNIYIYDKLIKRIQAVSSMFFKNKIEILMSTPNVDLNEMNVDDLMFIAEDKGSSCIKSLKIKSREGHDRVLQRLLVNGIDQLKTPITSLMQKIITKIQSQINCKMLNYTFFKKGSANNVENYRLISNLCLVSKIFENLMLQLLMDVEKFTNLDFTVNLRNGFKKNKSTATAGLVFQSIIPNYLDIN